ncbi:hypothetical protein CRE_01469 [Caenorhabditis remanei]|uniref:Uncharacterized protein n=1 Tax=Caenorhabditis remanei TaxID=31234 RepID=E3NPP5_CAERE|nr:hypothetical protein CRE_01469 [Caenorhabditis remanei]
MSIRDRKHRWVRRARLLMAIELFLSIIFDFTMIGSVKRGQMLNCLLVVVITLNILTGARLFLKLRGIKCASSIMAYVLWKIVQEVVMLFQLTKLKFPAWLARFLWQLQSTHASNNTDKNENATQISFIDGFHSEADHHQLLDTTSSRMNGANSNEALELREIPLREATNTTMTANSNRAFIPYDHVVPYLFP